MPDDDPPLSSTVTETVTTDTGADKETAASLNAQFEDFWKDEDAKTDGAPEAPGAGQETKEKPESRSRTETKPEPKIPDSEHKEISDEDIDKWGDLEEDPQNPQIKKQFSDIKALWHQDRAKAKAEAERAAKLERELEETRKNAWTPEQKADYEHAAAVRRKFDFASDPEFVQRFHQPIINTFQSLLAETVEALPDRAAAQAWAKYIAENYAPDALDKNWWNHSVIDKIPDETDKAAVRQGVANLLRMQKERDTEINRRSNDKSSYDNWIKERDESRAQYTQKEVMAEIGIQEQKIKEILRKDPAEAKTKEEREAIEKHNERFEKLNGHFQDTMKDLSFNGPRAMVRAAVEATRAMYIEGEYKKMEDELKATKKERDQLRSELDKIGGARRRISHTSGTPPTASGKDNSKNGTGLSLRDLDVRKSFDSFDWGDGSK
jgi:hypothetical protein